MFSAHQIGDCFFHAGIAESNAFRSLVPRGEEKFHFKDTLGRSYVLTRNGATDGCFVNANRVGYLYHGQRFKKGRTFLEKLTLPFHNLDRNIQNGLLPLVDALRQAGQVLGCNECEDRRTRLGIYCEACPLNDFQRPVFKSEPEPARVHSRRPERDDSIVLL